MFTLIGKLIRNRIDLALIDRALGRYILATKYPGFMNAIEWMEPAVETVNQHLMISKKTTSYRKIVKDFNKVLNKLRESGEMDDIMESHGF